MATVRPDYCRSCRQEVASLPKTVCEGGRWTLNISFNAKTALFRATPNLERQKVDVAYEVLICENKKSSHLCNLRQSALYTKQELLISIIMTKYTAPCFCGLKALIFLAFTKIAIFQ